MKGPARRWLRKTQRRWYNGAVSEWYNGPRLGRSDIGDGVIWASAICFFYGRYLSVGTRAGFLDSEDAPIEIRTRFPKIENAPAGRKIARLDSGQIEKHTTYFFLRSTQFLALRSFSNLRTQCARTNSLGRREMRAAGELAWFIWFLHSVIHNAKRKFRHRLSIDPINCLSKWKMRCRKL